MSLLSQKHSSAYSADEYPPISVVVIGRNEGPRLQRCLESVRQCDYPRDRIQVIYVDSESTDDSVAIARKGGAIVVELSPEFLSAAAGRNAGLAAATHEIIQFLDGDTVVNPDWLRTAVRALSAEGVAAVFGRTEEIDRRASVYCFWAHHDWHVSPGEADYCGGIAMFKAGPLRQVGGFDASLIAGEEQDLVFRIQRDCGLKVMALDTPMVLHDLHIHRFSQYWRRCYRAGYAYAEVVERLPGLRQWRRVCRRNAGHVLVAGSAVLASLVWMTPWPAIVWVALLGGAMVRSALRHRNRVGGLWDALVYSMHLYLCKLPMFCGQCNYRLRKRLGLRPQRLIEYNQPAGTRTADLTQGT